MSWMKGKASGWTAFDLKQRQKQGLQSEIEDDPFPPVSTSVNKSIDVRGKLRRNHEPSGKSFSSVLLPSKFPALSENKGNGNRVSGGGYGRKQGNLIVPVKSHDSAFLKLKEMFSWADDSLIRDILLSTEDDFEMAVDFLGGMVSADDSLDKKAEEPNLKIDGYLSDSGRSEYKTFGRGVTSSVKVPARSTYEDVGNYVPQESGGSSVFMNASDSEKLSDDISELDSIIQRLQSIPVEPEWEEDDLYFIHRKDALKMMRSASNHSRAAQKAFLRYDHASARQHSEQAREDWLTAEKLNSEAAKKITGITNRNNDIWKLDLHGLHATEAVQALEERLQKIEGPFTVNRSVSPNRGRSKNPALRSSSQEPFGRSDVEGLNSKKTSCRQPRNPLQVITGIGKHSRGHASLPLAVKTFLEDKRYRFDETRPGVITVWPKYRHN